MRVLLVQPNQKRTVGLQQMGLVEPLGLEMIAGALGEQHQVDIVDLRMAPDALAGALADLKPDMVGISSTFTVDMYQTFQVAEAAKAFNPQAFVFVGGHHPSLYPPDFSHPMIDAIVMGEGEVTAPALVGGVERGEDLHQIPGLILNGPQGQEKTDPRPPVSDLNTLPTPRRDLTRSRGWKYHMSLLGPVASVETARGCPYKCNFCSVWRFYEGRMRFKSPQRVLAELRSISEPTVTFTDDNFLADVPRATEIARLVEEEGISKRFVMQARSDTIANHPELIEQWARLGIAAIFMGFEKPDQSGLDSVNKHNSVENNEHALAVLRAHGVEPIATFIVDPRFTREDFAYLRDYVRKLRLQQVGFPILTPLPGTQVFDEMQAQLTTRNYELWDLSHLVLPTTLSEKEFCKQMASLYRVVYPRWKLRLGQGYFALRSLRPGGGDMVEARKTLKTVLLLQNPKSFMS